MQFGSWFIALRVIAIVCLGGSIDAIGSEQSPVAAHNRCVVLLHGLARTSRSMQTVANSLSAQGWRVVNQGYPSRSKPVEELTGAVASAFERCREQGVAANKIDFVTHSMGGILLRQWVMDTGSQIGRAVMLGPPNKGSELVDRLGRTLLFRVYNGPAGMQLGTDANAVWRRLPRVTFELGVIAGTGEEGGILGRHVAPPNDGKVSLESTRVAGMSDHLALPADHTFMMTKPEIHRQIQHFLLHGRFAEVSSDGSENRAGEG